MGRSSPSGVEDRLDARRAGSRSEGARPAIIALVLGAAVGLVVATVGSTLAPYARADATLQPTGVPPDELILRLLEPPESAHWEIDLVTLRGFGAHDGFEIWSASNAFGSSCIVAIHRPTEDVLAASCVPIGSTTFVDTRWHGLPTGAAYRFTLRRDAVDVDLLLPTEAP